MKRLFSLSEVEDLLKLLVVNQPARGEDRPKDAFSLIKKAEEVFSIVFSDRVRTGKVKLDFAALVHLITENLKSSGRLLRLVP